MTISLITELLFCKYHALSKHLKLATKTFCAFIVLFYNAMACGFAHEDASFKNYVQDNDRHPESPCTVAIFMATVVYTFYAGLRFYLLWEQRHNRSDNEV